MKRAMRASQAIGLTVAVFLATSAASAEQKSAFHVTASIDTGFAPTGWWKLDVDGDGTVTLVGDKMPLRQSSIPRERVKALRESVKGLLILYPYQGTACPDCALCTLRVNLEGREHSVTFGPFREEDPSALRRKHAQEFLDAWAAVKTATELTSLPDPCQISLTDAAPELLSHSVPSAYELFAGCTGGLGVFVMELTVATTGEVTHAKMLRGPGCAVAEQRILAAVRSWRYSPARNYGEAVERRITVSVAPGG
jgi:TonB family protein